MSGQQKESKPLEGAYGAFLYGGFIAALMVVLSGIAYAFVVFYTGNQDAAMWMVVRLVNMGLITGCVAGLGRWMCGGTSPSIISTSLVKGDLGGILGWGVGLVLAGSLASGSLGEITTNPGSSLYEKKPILDGPTLEGGPFRLDDCKGSWVLVDFWATWCKPCLEESPNIVEAHRQFADKGLKVVGVSLDNDREALKEYLKKHPYPWPQIIHQSPEKMGFNHPLAKENQIDSIPRIWLLNPEGKLVEAGLRGPEMIATIGKRMGVAFEETGSGRNPFLMVANWFFKGVLISPLYLFWGVTVGCGVLGAMAEAGIRFLLKR